MKNTVKALIPKAMYEFVRKSRRQYLEKQYFQQKLVQVQCGAYKIVAPENHLIVTISESQPYRDLCVGITAKYVSEKYPNGTIIDVGANIGDTAALISTYAPNKLILVDASDYFHDILIDNIKQLPNEVVIEKVMLSDGTPAAGAFEHKLGTAAFNEASESKSEIKTVRLADIADRSTCFVKIDTDGYDRKILAASLEWLQEFHPAILFESLIFTSQDLKSANNLYLELMSIGYKYFIVWDDPGFYLLSTSSFEALIDLNRYLYKVFQNKGRKSIYNYDILCLHEFDVDIYKQIQEWYRNY